MEQSIRPQPAGDTAAAAGGDGGHPLISEYGRYRHSLQVPEAFEHPDGFTTYKVLIQATPLNALEQDSLRYVLWTRYKALHQLHTRLGQVSDGLQLRTKLPDFPKPKLFGKHEPNIISERRAAAEAFLSFTIQQRHLCKAAVFLDFLREFELEPDDALYSTELIPVLEPTSLDSGNLPTTNSDRLVDIDPEDPQLAGEEPEPIVEHSVTTTVRTADNVARHGRLCHGEMASAATSDRRHPAQAPASRAGDIDNQTDAAGAQASTSASRDSLDQQQQQPAFTINDCSLASDDAPDSQAAEHDSPLHRMLLRAQGAKTVHHESPVSSSSETPDAVATTSQTVSTEATTMTSHIRRFFPKVGGGQTEKDGAPATQPPPPQQQQQRLAVQQQAVDGMKKVGSESSFLDLLLSSGKTEPPDTAAPKRNAMIRFLSRTGARNGQTDQQQQADADGYLIAAAQFISKAQKAEADCSYETAFTCYKSAVNLLLQGVQREQDVGRRNAVRKKTAKYLRRAEQLYATRLAFDSGTFDERQPAWTDSQAGVHDPTLVAFQGERAELRRLQPLAVLPRPADVSSPAQPNVSSPSFAQLVLDTATGQHYVLKILDKTCHLRAQTPAHFVSQTSENFVPMQIPRMANLVKFYETDNAVVLLIEYSALGSVRSLLADYFDECALRHDGEQNGGAAPDAVPDVDALTGDNGKQRVSRRSSSYSGHHISFRVDNEPDVDDIFEEESAATPTGNRLRGRVECRESADSYFDEPVFSQTAVQSSQQQSVQPCGSVEPDEAWAMLTRLIETGDAWPRRVGLPECVLAQWMADAIVAVTHLHEEGVVLRKLEQHDLLLTADGRVQLSYVSQWNCVDVPPLWHHLMLLRAAPETVAVIQSDQPASCSYYAIGALFYELLTGRIQPLHTRCLHGLAKHTPILFNDDTSPLAQDFIKKLLSPNRLTRLGCHDIDELRGHPFLRQVHWDDQHTL